MDKINEISAEDMLKKVMEEDPYYDVNTGKTVYVQKKVVPLHGSNKIPMPIPFDEFVKDRPEKTEYVINDYLPTEGIAMIYAPSGAGKTLFALNLAYAIAQGKPFLGLQATKPRRVLFIDAEMSHNELWERSIATEMSQGILDFPTNLQIITQKKLAPHPMPHLDDPRGQEQIMYWMLECNFDVVIFDNLGFLTSIDLNRGSEWKIVQDFFMKLRKTGKTTIFIHHAGKGGDYAGSSRIIHSLNLCLAIRPVIEDTKDPNAVIDKKFRIIFEKVRQTCNKGAASFEATLHQNGQWSTTSLEQTDLCRVAELVELKMSQRNIAEELGLNLSKVHRMIKKAKAQKLIRSDNLE